MPKKLFGGNDMKKLISIVLLTLSILLIPMSAFAAERHEILKQGDKDKWVLELQEALYEKGYLKVKPTGYYGTDTQSAVIAYQKDHDLRVDGKAGPETLSSLYGDDYEPIPETRFAEEDDNETVTPKYEDALKVGDRGDTVTAVQEALKKYGYYYYEKITGYYGPITEEAVRKFQRSNELTETGSLNEDELALLLEGRPKYYVMYQGDKGDDIELMQQRLRTLGYMDSSSTGYFGTITLAAVKEFQEVNGLKVDGKVGKDTRAILYSEDAKKAPEKAENKEETTGENKEETEEPVEKDMVTKFIDMAKAQLGKEYVYSTEGPDTFDCSGLVYYCLKNIGYKVSRMSSRSYAKFDAWEDVESKADLKKGDLVFFCSSKSTTISHIAIYIGGGEIIHAIPSENSVYISTLTGYWDKYYVSAKRIF